MANSVRVRVRVRVRVHVHVRTALVTIVCALPTAAPLTADAATAGPVGTAYSVDCSARTGGTGTMQSPWNSLATVDAHSAFRPGDSILLKRGAACTGRVHPRGKGSSGAPIVLGAYGKGARPATGRAGVSTLNGYRPTTPGNDPAGSPISKHVTRDFFGKGSMRGGRLEARRADRRRTRRIRVLSSRAGPKRTIPRRLPGAGCTPCRRFVHRHGEECRLAAHGHSTRLRASAR